MYTGVDVADTASVEAFAKAFQQREKRLDVLINNAGIFDMSGAYVRTSDGREQHLQANFLAPALLTMTLLNALRKTNDRGTGDTRPTKSTMATRKCPGRVGR